MKEEKVEKVEKYQRPEPKEPKKVYSENMTEHIYPLVSVKFHGLAEGNSNTYSRLLTNTEWKHRFNSISSKHDFTKLVMLLRPQAMSSIVGGSKDIKILERDHIAVTLTYLK